MISTTQYSTFINLISKMDLTSFLGLCATLCVDCSKDREFEDVLEDVLDNFCKLPRKSRKDLIKLLKLASAEGDKNGVNSENS